MGPVSALGPGHGAPIGEAYDVVGGSMLVSWEVGGKGGAWVEGLVEETSKEEGDND